MTDLPPPTVRGLTAKLDKLGKAALLFPVPQQLGHMVIPRARPTEKPEYTQRSVKHYLFCNCATF